MIAGRRDRAGGHSIRPAPRRLPWADSSCDTVLSWLSLENDLIGHASSFAVFSLWDRRRPFDLGGHHDAVAIPMLAVLGMMSGSSGVAQAGTAAAASPGEARSGAATATGPVGPGAQVRDLPGQEEGASLAAQGVQRPDHRHLRAGLQGQARLQERDRPHQEGRGHQADLRDLRGRQENIAGGSRRPTARSSPPPAGLQGQARLRELHRRDQEGGREGQGRGGGGMTRTPFFGRARLRPSLFHRPALPGGSRVP